MADLVVWPSDADALPAQHPLLGTIFDALGAKIDLLPIARAYFDLPMHERAGSGDVHVYEFENDPGRVVVLDTENDRRTSWTWSRFMCAVATPNSRKCLPWFKVFSVRLPFRCMRASEAFPAGFGMPWTGAGFRIRSAREPFCNHGPAIVQTDSHGGGPRKALDPLQVPDAFLRPVEHAILQWIARRAAPEAQRALASQIEKMEVSGRTYTNGGGVFVRLAPGESAIAVPVDWRAAYAAVEGPELSSPELGAGASATLHVDQDGWTASLEIFAHGGDYPSGRHPENMSLAQPFGTWIDLRPQGD